MDGVHESIKVIKQYRLLCEDFDSLEDLISWLKQKNLIDGVDVKVKVALTYTYEKKE